jgi:hypothetical protein
MPTDKARLITAIETYKDELVETTCRYLQKLHGSHYEMIDYERHLEREEAFLDAILQGLREETTESFLTYVNHLSAQRVEEGYSLQEFQTAFNVVADTLWNMLVTHFPPDDALVGMLALVNTLFRSAKDHLAQVFLQEALEAQKELEEVRKKFRAYRKVTKRSYL